MSEGALASDVWLGLAGDLIDSDEYFDHYCTRVGGVAVLPASPPAWSTPTCAVCGKPLSLVLQVGPRGPVCAFTHMNYNCMLMQL